MERAIQTSQRIGWIQYKNAASKRKESSKIGSFMQHPFFSRYVASFLGLNVVTNLRDLVKDDILILEERGRRMECKICNIQGYDIFDDLVEDGEMSGGKVTIEILTHESRFGEVYPTPGFRIHSYLHYNVDNDGNISDTRPLLLRR